MNADREVPSGNLRRRRGIWRWLVVCLLLAALGLAIAANAMLHRAGPILRGRIVETLSARFNSHVELDVVNVSVGRGIDVTGQGLRIFPPDDLITAGATTPLIVVREFSFHAGLRGLFLKPTHIGTVRVSGMTISIPPRQMRRQGGGVAHRGKIKVLVDTIAFDGSRLVLQNARADKDPRTFALRRIAIRDYGANSRMSYDAQLLNAIPRGEIHAVGTFGPWNTESPGDSAVTGGYVFDHAELGTIHGIGGTLRSTGEFSGQLNRIEVTGATDTPNFSLDSANHPMQLHTAFHAIVDGMSGDTYLEPVEARLGRSALSCRGEVVNVRGAGHHIKLDVEVPDGHIDEFLRLAVRSQPLMTGRVVMHARLEIPPGKESVVKKLWLKAAFSLRQVHFTNPATEEKIDALSLRAQGRPKEAVPGAADVSSMLSGDFAMRTGRMDFSRLDYSMPGGKLELAGAYSVDTEQIDFRGSVRTEAKVSQMVMSRWKSWLLKPVDPFFRREGFGAVIPVRVSGTKDDPKFSLDFGRKNTDTPPRAPKR